MRREHYSYLPFIFPSCDSETYLKSGCDSDIWPCGMVEVNCEELSSFCQSQDLQFALHHYRVSLGCGCIFYRPRIYYHPDETILEGLPMVRLHVQNMAFTGKGLEPLRGMPLTDVSLSVRLVGDYSNMDVLELLRGKPLTSLILHYESSGGDVEYGSHLDSLRGMPLTLLELDKYDLLSDAGLDALRGMPLTSLKIHSEEDVDRISDAGLDVLRGMPLTELSLKRWTSITDSGIEVLRGMQLTNLNLEWVGILDEGMAVLRLMPLTDLDLLGTHITNAGLEHLEGAPLTQLDLDFCSEITGTGLKALGSAPLHTVTVSVDCASIDPWKVAEFWEDRAYFEMLDKDGLERLLGWH